MYGRIKEEKLRSGNMVFSVQQVKGELEGSIDVENKRVNIDSAKKRAVLQGMDYEGFRQMVLGAHLFKISSKQLIDLNPDRFSRKTGETIVLNSQMTTFNNVVDLSVRQRDEIEATNMRIAEMLANNELQSTNFRAFKKNFDSSYQEPIDDKEDNLKKIFCLDFDVTYFTKIVRVMNYITKESLIPNKNTTELYFLMNFLNTLRRLKDFQFVVPKFLNAKEKLELKELLTFWSEAIPALYQPEVVTETNSNTDTVTVDTIVEKTEKSEQSESDNQTEKTDTQSNETEQQQSTTITQASQESEQKQMQQSDNQSTIAVEDLLTILTDLSTYYIK